jgi:hypothetical protein
MRLSLKNENIGLVVAFAIVIAGHLAIAGKPNELESIVIAVLGLGAGFWLSVYLNFRDGTFTRLPRQ